MLKLLGWYSRQKIYFKVLPFLCIYLLFIIHFSVTEFAGDEGRYVTQAENLLHGFYSPPFPNINLWNGPGYPIILIPFIYLKLPYIYIKLLNAFFLYFSLIYCYKSVGIFASKKTSIIYTFILGFYFPMYLETRYMLTEPLSWFLITLICYLTLKCFKQKEISWKLLFLSAFTIAYLAMTKAIFGYVITLMIFVSLAMFLFSMYKYAAKKATLLFVISFIFCLPWLFYTYTLTHRSFYWLGSGSMSLYSMSSPYKNELGDWDIFHSSSIPNPERAAFMDSIAKLSPLDREEAFKATAIINIKRHPEKYFSNWIANVGRLFFSMPFSNTFQSTRLYFTLIPNMIIVVIIFLILLASIKYYKKFPISIVLLFIFISIYLFGSTLVSTYPRMFQITIPFWFILFAYFFSNVIIVKIRGYKESDKPLL